MSYLMVKGFGKLSLITPTNSINHFTTRHAESLLGFFLLNQDQIHSRDMLIEILWPQKRWGDSRGCLSTVLWRLRSQLKKVGLAECLSIQSTRENVIFCPQIPLNFDVENFEKQLAIAKSIESDTQKFRALITAIEIYQGDLFDGVYADWCLIQRERLARMRLQALGDLMFCYMRQNAFVKAIEIGRSILKDDPLREEVHRALIYCYGRLGQRSQVAKQFQLCADQLFTELQVLPMPDTIRLYQLTMASLLEQNLTSSYQTHVKRAQRAFDEFQAAGDQLHAALSALEPTNQPHPFSLN